MRVISCLLAGALLLAACGTPAPDPNEVLPTRRAEETPFPTLPAPAYQPPSERITAANAASIRYLGRLEQFLSPQSTLFAHAISLDGTRMAALNNDMLINWDLVDGTVAFGETRGGATNVYYSSDKTEIYAVASSGLVRVNDARRGDDLNEFQSSVSYNGISAFYGEDGWLAMGGSDGRVQVWDTYERRSLVTYAAHTAVVTGMVFSHDGTRLATAADDGSTIVWDWAKREALYTIQTPTAVSALAFSPDGERLALASALFVEVHHLGTGTQEYVLDVGVSGGDAVLGFSPDSQYLLTGGTQDFNIYVLNAADGSVKLELPNTKGLRTSAVFSPDGDLLATTVLDGSVTLWNLAAATETSIPSARLLVGSTRITSAEWSQDGYTLAFFDASGVVFIWGIASAER